MTQRRREFLKAGCAAAVLPLAAAVAPATAQGASDADLLAKLVELEQEASLLYGTLAAPRAVPARLFRAQSRQHVRGLTMALRNRGGRPPAPRARVGRATPQQALALEERALAAYSHAIGDFGEEALLPTLAAAMANHGQHAVVLRLALRRHPLSTAFPPGGVR
jgi:hypothetical protein